MRITMTAAAFAMALVGAPATAQEVNDIARKVIGMGAPILTGEKLREAIAGAASFPLGSEQNPVRADGPPGQRAYLSRLRCPDGTAPAYVRGGSTGEGPYGSILDVYNVSCAGQQASEVFMDMYHKHEESRPITGFRMDAAGT